MVESSNEAIADSCFFDNICYTSVMEQSPPSHTNPDPEGYTQTPSHSPEQDEGLGFDPALPLEPQPAEEMNDLLNEQAAPEVISMNGLKRFVADRRARRLTRIEKKISDIR